MYIRADTSHTIPASSPKSRSALCANFLPWSCISGRSAPSTLKFRRMRPLCDAPQFRPPNASLASPSALPAFAGFRRPVGFRWPWRCGLWLRDGEAAMTPASRDHLIVPVGAPRSIPGSNHPASAAHEERFPASFRSKLPVLIGAAFKRVPPAPDPVTSLLASKTVDSSTHGARSSSGTGTGLGPTSAAPTCRPQPRPPQLPQHQLFRGARFAPHSSTSCSQFRSTAASGFPPHQQLAAPHLLTTEHSLHQAERPTQPVPPRLQLYLQNLRSSPR